MQVIGNLGAGESALCQGTIGLVNPRIAPYSQLRLTSYLEVGRIDGVTQPRVIQIREHTLQVAQRYHVPASSEFSEVLLVVNGKTQQAEVLAWQSLVRRIYPQAETSVWNVSLYGGIYTDFRPRAHTGGESLKEKWRGKLMVVLDLPYERADAATTTTSTPTVRFSVRDDFMPLGDFHECARDYGMHVCVVGSGVAYSGTGGGLSTGQASPFVVDPYVPLRAASGQ